MNKKVNNKRTKHKGGENEPQIIITNTIIKSISNTFEILIPFFFKKDSASFVGKYEAKYSADKDSETTTNANFQFRIRNTIEYILIDFINLYIDESHRGKGILTNVFNKIEEIINTYAENTLCEKQIILRVSDFNNMLLGCHFVLNRGYTLYNPYKDQTTDPKKMREFVQMYKSEPQKKNELINTYLRYIPPNVQKAYVSETALYPWMNKLHISDFGFVENP